MEKLFSTVNPKLRSYRAWAKRHKRLGFVGYFIGIGLLCPLLIAYGCAYMLTHKISSNPFTKALAYGVLGFGLLFNIALVAAAASDKPPVKQAAVTKPAAATTTPQPVQAAKIADQPVADMYKVAEVVDGDTIKVELNGKSETVRLIGVDTPETVDPRKTVQCFGQEASNFTKKALSGKSVKLEADPSQGDRDKYSRLLRYVVLEDGANFNKLLLSEGYAYEYTYNIPYKYQAEFKAAQKAAENGSKGLWAASACSGQRTKPQAATPQPTPAPATAAPSGNCNPNYTPCVPNSAADLDCADIGFKVKIVGTDVYRLDGKDKDGYGCEAY